MTGGSEQLREYRIARRDGKPTDIAAQMAGIALSEAWLIDADDKNHPPGPECFEPIPPAPVGHNSGEIPMTINVSADMLRLFIERIERLEQEKKGIADDIRDVYSEAKSQGYDAKIMRECVRLRKMEKDARDERQALIETYGVQLGLF